jgi:hypothetical protein
MITLRQVTSSNIKAIGHDGSDLYVLFDSQEIYSYTGVPTDLFSKFMLAPSKGQFLNKEIKPAFTAQKFTGQYRVQDPVTLRSLRDLLPGPSFGF